MKQLLTDIIDVAIEHPCATLVCIVLFVAASCVSVKFIIHVKKSDNV